MSNSDSNKNVVKLKELRRIRIIDPPRIPDPISSQKPDAVPLDQALQDIVGSVMAVGDVIALLTKHNCTDLTSFLDTSASSQYPIANGGLGDVFSGKLIDGTLVAIKTIRPYDNTNSLAGTYQKRAAKEIYTWSKCEHPNVVGLMGLAIFRRSLAMISLWEENGSLLHYLSHHQDADRCQLSKSICTGLAYLHENGIVHGDLKGANVLIAQDRRPMLMDFGNASLRVATLNFTQTSSQPNLSLRWTAPEILKGESVHTTNGDIYSLGMTILETLTSEIPFLKRSDQSIMMHVVVKKATPVRPRKVIPERSIYGNILWAVLTSCWSYDPDLRPNAQTILDALRPLTPDKLEELEEKVAERDESDDD